MKVTIIVSDEAWRKLNEHERAMLTARLCDPLFAKFIQFQREAAGEQALSLNPASFSDDKALEYLNQARHLRAIENFWVELGDFISNLYRQARSGG